MDPFHLKWRFFSNLVFVVVYEGFQSLVFIDTLLDQVKNEFIKHVTNAKKRHGKAPVTGRARDIVFDASHRCLPVPKNDSERSLPSDFTPIFRKLLNSAAGKQTKSSGGGGDEASNISRAIFTTDEPRSNNDSEDSVKASRAAFISRQTQSKHASSDAKAASGSKKTAKKPQSWGTQRITAQSMAALDFSKPGDVFEASGDADRDNYAGGLGPDDDGYSSGDDDIVMDDTNKGGMLSRLTAAVQSVTGNKVMLSADLDPVLEEMKMMMMERNVAAQVATQICESVRADLLDRRSERFTSVKEMVLQALRKAIESVMTPKRIVDVLRDALQAKSQSQVYSIVFLGVNGVGKSTSLAKVAHYLKHKGQLSVMIAACDTFRAGAVEQLRTHARNIDLPLFEKGYGKDAANVAKEAIAHAKTNGIDVVLIDTAGRMQDNEPLMRSLAKLVDINKPNLVLFVGEGLVGNDAIDQLIKFNQSLIDYASSTTTPRGIDGVLMTKFDTVDEKVGAALSMVYITRQPIVFIGTGQKYTHLRKLQVNTIVSALTS
eukprot:GHVN01067148.1.p1 GENE.GHVN01067148.1~~GHVN01067148.1.p1  ORF type:complete len:545 (-),score=66.53 GHVN01067148.1:2001-3635(-)